MKYVFPLILVVVVGVPLVINWYIKQQPVEKGTYRKRKASLMAAGCGRGVAGVDYKQGGAK